jgi:hypothetical protein
MFMTDFITHVLLKMIFETLGNAYSGFVHVYIS